MGFFKKLGEGISNASKAVANEVGKQVKEATRKNLRWQGYVRLKNKILKNKSLTELKRVCQDYSGEEPALYYRDPIDGRKRKHRNPRDVYQRFIIKKISLDSLIEYGRRKKMPMNEIIKEKKKIDVEFEKNNPFKPNDKNDSKEKEDNFESKEEDDFEVVLNIIDKFNPESVRDEKDLEIQLKQYLRAKLEDRNIETQYKTANGDIDIVVDKEYGIELKLVESVKILENLFGQVRKYVKEMGRDKIAVVMMVDKNISQESIDDAVERYEEMGARVLIIEKGNIKRRKRKSQTFKLVR